VSCLRPVQFIVGSETDDFSADECEDVKDSHAIGLRGKRCLLVPAYDQNRVTFINCPVLRSIDPNPTDGRS
jgi:hypothetical protein